MKLWLTVLLAAVGITLAGSAGAETRRATVVLPTVGCKTPEAYNDAARLTAQRRDPGSRGMLRDYLERHGCVGFREGETVMVRKSGTFEGGRFIQLRRDPQGPSQNRRGPQIYWTVPEAIGR